MIDHIVRLEATLDASGESDLFARWDRLRRIPGVRELRYGCEFGGRAGTAYCLRVVFDNRADLAAYEQHPVHEEVSSFNRAHIGTATTVDFEWA